MKLHPEVLKAQARTLREWADEWEKTGEPRSESISYNLRSLAHTIDKAAEDKPFEDALPPPPVVLSNQSIPEELEPELAA